MRAQKLLHNYDTIKATKQHTVTHTLTANLALVWLCDHMLFAQQVHGRATYNAWSQTLGPQGAKACPG